MLWLFLSFYIFFFRHTFIQEDGVPASRGEEVLQHGEEGDGSAGNVAARRHHGQNVRGSHGGFHVTDVIELVRSYAAHKYRTRQPIFTCGEDLKRANPTRTNTALLNVWEIQVTMFGIHLNCLSL